MDHRDLLGDASFVAGLRQIGSHKHADISRFSDAQLFELLQVQKHTDEFLSRRASLLFDGEHLFWLERGHERQWLAWSGREGYWSPDYQSLRDKGPIPAGIYEVKQEEYREWEATPILNRASCILAYVKIKLGSWPGCTWAWGTRRIGLTPKPWTRIFGRSGFTIHGGSTPGSAGCIDLTESMLGFATEFRNYAKDMLLEVKYKPLRGSQGYHRRRLERP